MRKKSSDEIKEAVKYITYIYEGWILTIPDKPSISIHNSQCEQWDGENDFNWDDTSREKQEMPILYFLMEDNCCLDIRQLLAW